MTYLEYIPAKLILMLFRAMPRALALKIGDGLAILSYLVLGNYRNICHRNLDIAFPGEIDKTNKKNITKKAFLNMVRTFIELLLMPNLKATDIIKRSFCQNHSEIDDSLAKGKGVITCSSHFSNWYWPAIYAASVGYKVNVVVRPLDNKLLDKEMNRILNEKKITVIPRYRAVKQCLKALKNNEFVALQIDQNQAMGGVFVPFFGVEASTMRGAWVLKKMSDCEVAACYAIRKGNFHHVYYSRMLNLPKSEKEYLKTINQCFEPVIREHKESYFWLHPRWKKRPKGETGLYSKLKV